jgi:ABC-2 type transport system ATP-binding protein
MIEVSGLTKYYGETRAISDLSFTIDRGEIAGFLGLNGAGKSTALKILAGFLLPTSGSVQIDGVDVVAEPERVRSQIGFLPEEPPLYKEMTVGGFLTYLGKLRGMAGATVASRLPDVLAKTGLEGRADQVIETMSLGYRKRVGIAQAIIHDPSLVILDEPVSGLDPLQRVEMRKLIRALGGEHTVLISSHNLTEVEETCDQLLILGDGNLVAQGSEEDINSTVGSGERMEVDVHGDAEAAAALLQDLDEVREASVSDPGEDFSEIEITLVGQDVHEEARWVVNALIGGGFGVSRIAPAKGELEDLFLKITGKGGAA